MRDDKILAMRVDYAVRHANRYGEVTLDVDTARALLARVAPAAASPRRAKITTLDADARRRLRWLYKRKDTLRPMAAGGFVAVWGGGRSDRSL